MGNFTETEFSEEAFEEIGEMFYRGGAVSTSQTFIEKRVIF